MGVPHPIRRVTVGDGVSVPVADQGSTAGACAVLVHGMGDSWRSYERVLENIPDDVRVLAPSLRGHGDADRPASGYTPERPPRPARGPGRLAQRRRGARRSRDRPLAVQDPGRSQLTTGPYSLWNSPDTAKAREFEGGLFARIDDWTGGAITNMEPGKRGARVYLDMDEINAGVARVKELGGEGSEARPCRAWAGSRSARTGRGTSSASDRATRRPPSDPDREKSQRVMSAMLSMTKIEIDELERAAAHA